MYICILFYDLGTLSYTLQSAKLIYSHCLYGSKVSLFGMPTIDYLVPVLGVGGKNNNVC